MGVDILWLIPMHPSVGKSKGHRSGLIKDCLRRGWGLVKDFRAFVDAAHALGMRVILTGLATTRYGTTRWLKNILSGIRVIEGQFRPTPGGIGRTLSTSIPQRGIRDT